MSGKKYLANGEESKPYKRWKERYENKLEILENGFVIFKPNMFDKGNFKVNWDFNSQLLNEKILLIRLVQL